MAITKQDPSYAPFSWLGWSKLADNLGALRLSGFERHGLLTRMKTSARKCEMNMHSTHTGDGLF